MMECSLQGAIKTCLPPNNSIPRIQVKKQGDRYNYIHTCIIQNTPNQSNQEIYDQLIMALAHDRALRSCASQSVVAVTTVSVSSGDML